MPKETNRSGDTAGTNTPRNRANATATAAMVPVWITRNSVHPYRKPGRCPSPSRRKTYCPPALGIAAASSPYDSAPATVISPVTTQIISSPPGEFICRAMSADTMKIPEPIMEPTTSMVASSSDSPRLNSLSGETCAAGSAAVERGMGAPLGGCWWRWRRTEVLSAES